MRTVENPIALSAKTKMKASAAAMLLALLIIYHSNFVSAASGGRMGGWAEGRSIHLHLGHGLQSHQYRVDRPPDRVVIAARTAQGLIHPMFSKSASAGLLLLLISVCALYKYLEDYTQKTTSVIKLQVGIAGLATSLQKDLNLIAESADTSNPRGLHYLFTETIATVLRHSDHCISSYSSVDVKSSREEGEKGFNRLSIEERGKFDEETLVNFNNIKKRSSTTIQRNSGFNSKYIVITILVGVGGVYKQPRIHSSKDLKEALQKLSSILDSYS